MNNAPRRWWRQESGGRIAPVTAKPLPVDPLAAARRLLGAALTGRGVSAMIEAAPGVNDIADPAERAIAARGRYIVMTTGCIGCHVP